MADTSTIAPELAGQEQILKSAINCYASNKWGQLLGFLEILATNIKDEESLAEIHRIRSSTTINFDDLELYYQMSFMADKRRGVHFRDLGRLTYPEIRQIMQKQVSIPTKKVMVHILSKITKGPFSGMSDVISHETGNVEEFVRSLKSNV